MHRSTITAIDYRSRQYWGVAGMYDREIIVRLKLIPGTYFSRTNRCWLVLRSQISKQQLESILIIPEKPKCISVPTASALAQLYQSTWRVIAPLDPDVLPKFHLPKSAKYRCILRMLYSYDLSISQICGIKLAHINWGADVLEIQIPDLRGNKAVLSRVTSQLVTDYILQAQPEEYLFEAQPGCAYPEEKLHRCLVTYIQAPSAVLPRQRTV